MGDDSIDRDCEFCEIVAGDRAANVLYEDETTIAFLDDPPAVTGHSLIVPRAHEGEVLTTGDASGVFRTVRIVAAGLEEALEPEGFSVFHTSGPLVGSVDHAHVHLLPRFEDDGVSLALARDQLREDEADRLAAVVRTAIDTDDGRP